MLENDDVVSVQRNLMAGKYAKVLSDLRRLGRPIKQSWLKSPSSNNTEKYKFTLNPVFKQFLVEEIEKSKVSEAAKISAPDSDTEIPLPIDQLKNQLSRLALFLTAWKDDPNLSQETESEQLAVSESDKKRTRQLIKYKASLDKDDRYAVNIALQSMVFILCQQTNNFIKHQETAGEIYAENRALTEKEISKFKDIRSKQGLLNFISKHIQSLNEFASDRKLSFSEALSSNEQQEILEIGAAITAFQTPNKKKKLIKYAGILLALIAALACGLSTGMAIFLLFPSLPLAISLGIMIGLAGFYANFNFFSVNFPNFLITLLKKGGITEYINHEGKHRQLSTTYKFLLLPVVLASITVGLGTIALTTVTILNAIASILAGATILKVGTAIPLIISALSMIWPPLPLIILGIVGILAVTVGIMLTIAVLTALLSSMKEIAALNMTFPELCKHAYTKCLEWFKNFKNLKTHQKFRYAIMGLLLPFSLFGLAYFRYIAGVDLAVFISVIGAAVTGVISYIAQVAFTVIAINKLCNILIKPFSSSATTNQESSTLAPKSIYSQVKSNFISPVCLLSNAIGNGFLGYDGSGVSVAGAAACGVNSLAGNLSEPDMNQPKRKQANLRIFQEYEDFLLKSKEKSPIMNMQADRLVSNRDELVNPQQGTPKRSESLDDSMIPNESHTEQTAEVYKSSSYNNAGLFKSSPEDKVKETAVEQNNFSLR